MECVGEGGGEKGRKRKGRGKETGTRSETTKKGDQSPTLPHSAIA